MSNGFQRVLNHIRSIAGTEAEKGRLFERLMKAYFRQDPLYGDRFSDVWLWHPSRTRVRTAPVTATRPSRTAPSRDGYDQRRAPRRASSSATRASAARRAAASRSA